MTYQMPQRRRVTTATLSACAVLALAACGPQQQATTSKEAPECGFSAELIEAAQQEGAVTMYGGSTRQTSDRLAAEFKDAYGITATVVRQPSEEAVRLLSAELASGKVNADVIALSDSAAMADLEARGVLTDAELPNRDQIRDGLDDPGSSQVPNAATALGVVYNADAGIEVPQDWNEVASFPGRIAVADPSKSGSALVFFASLEDELGEGFLAEIAERDVIVTDSALALSQLVLTGEVDIAMPAPESAIVAAVAGGEPLAIQFPSGGTPVLVTELGVLAEAPHPNAAKLLVGFQLCTAYQKTNAEHGARSVLRDAPVAKGVQELPAGSELTLPLPRLQEIAGDLRDRFAKLFS